MTKLEAEVNFPGTVALLAKKQLSGEELAILSDELEHGDLPAAVKSKAEGPPLGSGAGDEAGEESGGERLELLFTEEQKTSLPPMLYNGNEVSPCPLGRRAGLNCLRRLLLPPELMEAAEDIMAPVASSSLLLLLHS